MDVLKVFFLFLMIVNPVNAVEPEAVVIEVRKKVKLHKTEKVYPDYFINGGTKLGLQSGAVVSVVRRVPVHDPFLNSSIGDFRIKVADVEIIHSDGEKAIARLVNIDRRAERPMVKYDSIMVGDRLDLATIRSKSVAGIQPFMVPSGQEILKALGEDPNTPMASVEGKRKLSSVKGAPLPEKDEKLSTPMEKKVPSLTNPQPK